MMRPFAEVKQTTLKEGMVKQHNLMYPSKRPITRENFYKEIDTLDFIEHVRVGIQLKERLKSMLPNKLNQKIKSL